MSDSPKELQDEVSGDRDRFFAVASLGVSYAKPGHEIFKTYGAARTRLQKIASVRDTALLRRKRVGPEPRVFAVYPRRKKDASFKNNTWVLVRRAHLHSLADDDIIAFAVEDAMMR